METEYLSGLTSLSSLFVDMQNHVIKKGARDLGDFATEIMQQLVDEPLNVAVLGRPSSDKTKLIHSLCLALSPFNNLGSHHHSLQLTPPSLSILTPTLTSRKSFSFGEDEVIIPDTFDTPKRKLTRNSSTPSLDSAFSLSPKGDLTHLDNTQEARTNAVPPIDEMGHDDEGIFVNEDTSDSEIEGILNNEQGMGDNGVEMCDNGVAYYWLNYVPDIRFWDVPYLGSELILDSNIPEYIQSLKQPNNFDGYIVCSGSRYVNQEDMELLNLLHKDRHAVFVYTNLGRDVDDRARRSRTSVSEAVIYRDVRSYYRKKLFKHSVWDIPFFITDKSNSEKFDIVDLKRQILRMSKRKQKGRKEILTKIASKAVVAKRDLSLMQNSVVSSLCALSTADGYFQYPILPIIGDALLNAYTYYMPFLQYGASPDVRKDLRLEETLTDPDDSLVDVRWLVKRTPCCLTWAAHRCLVAAAGRMHPDAIYPFTLLAGVGALAVFGVSRTRLTDALASIERDTTDIVHYVMNVHIPKYVQLPSATSTRPGSRAASPPSFGR